MRKKNNESKEPEVKQKRRKQNQENKELTKGVEIANKEAKRAAKADKKAKKSKAKKENKEERKDNTKRKTAIKYVIGLCVIVLIICLYRYRHIIGITFFKDITEKDAIIVETVTSDNKIYAYKNEILVYSKGKLSTYNQYGKNTWEYSFDETFIPEINTAGKYIQVINKNNGYVYIFDNKYESCRRKINGTIKRASINEKGESVIHYSKEGVKSSVGVYDKKGKEKYDITLKDENIAKVDLSQNGKYLLLYEVDTQGISPNSIVKIIDLKNADKVNTVLDVKNDVIYDIILKDSKIKALTTSKVYSYNILTKNSNEYDLSDKNISNIDIDNTGVAYVHKEISEEDNTVTVLNNSYEVVGEHKFSDNVKNFIYYNSLAYVVSNKEINIYNRWGMHIKSYKSNSLITTPVVFNDGKNVAINYSNRIVIIGI